MKKVIALIICSLAFLQSYAFFDLSGASVELAMQGGVGLGSILAVVISWDRNHSIIWAILHAVCGWLYVIYYIVLRSNQGNPTN